MHKKCGSVLFLATQPLLLLFRTVRRILQQRCWEEHFIAYSDALLTHRPKLLLTALENHRDNNNKYNNGRDRGEATQTTKHCCIYPENRTLTQTGNKRPKVSLAVQVLRHTCPLKVPALLVCHIQRAQDVFSHLLFTVQYHGNCITSFQYTKN